MKVSLVFYFIQVFSLLTKQLIWCEEIFIGNASNNENATENNSKSLYPTSAHNYDSPNNSLSPTNNRYFTSVIIEELEMSTIHCI